MGRAAATYNAAVMPRANCGPSHAVNPPASAGPAAPVTAYAMLSSAFARSHSRLGTINGSKDRAAVAQGIGQRSQRYDRQQGHRREPIGHIETDDQEQAQRAD